MSINVASSSVHVSSRCITDVALEIDTIIVSTLTAEALGHIMQAHLAIRDLYHVTNDESESEDPLQQHMAIVHSIGTMPLRPSWWYLVAARILRGLNPPLSYEPQAVARRPLVYVALCYALCTLADEHKHDVFHAEGITPLLMRDKGMSAVFLDALRSIDLPVLNMQLVDHLTEWDSAIFTVLADKTRPKTRKTLIRELGIDASHTIPACATADFMASQILAYKDSLERPLTADERHKWLVGYALHAHKFVDQLPCEWGGVMIALHAISRQMTDDYLRDMTGVLCGLGDGM